MVTAPPVPPETLDPAEAETLLALIEADDSLIHAAQLRGVPPAELLALIDRPSARRAMESLSAFAALRRELRADTAREELVNTLRHVARTTPDLVQKRLAATAALRALDRPVRSTVPRPSASFERGGADGRATSERAPSSRLARPYPPIGGIDPAKLGAAGSRGAPSSTPPPRPETHEVAADPETPDFMQHHSALSAPDSGPALPLNGHARAPAGEPAALPALAGPALMASSPQHAARSTQHDEELDEELDAEIDAAEDTADDEADDDAADAAEDAAEDAELDAAYPETLALARQILADIELNPEAHHPDAIYAAQILVKLERDHPTTHPP